MFLLELMIIMNFEKLLETCFGGDRFLSIMAKCQSQNYSFLLCINNVPILTEILKRVQKTFQNPRIFSSTSTSTKHSVLDIHVYGYASKLKMLRGLFEKVFLQWKVNLLSNVFLEQDLLNTSKKVQRLNQALELKRRYFLRAAGRNFSKLSQDFSFKRLLIFQFFK